ncbi:methyltransferase, FkbM family [Yoonia rosea]|uniref:Methyltransferase, FkbM family n=2 Tax=Yoonia rosea TaxID=287098 RepID=A0A1R3XFQ9_9RHOB|nr:methyltransferase, FkbM family [Yoonia rosea]
MNAETKLQPSKRHRDQIIKMGGPIGAVAQLSQYSERKGAVLDVGVNRGTMALHLCRLFCDMPIHLIEPIPAQCDYVLERFSRFPTVKVHQMALSHETGQSDFHIADYLGNSSLFTNNDEDVAQHTEHATIETITVETSRLDDWCAAQAIDHIACMKLDTQGSEFNILTGAKTLLSRNAIDIIMLEWFSLPHYDGVPLLEDILILMRSHGYVLYNIYPSRKLKTGVLRYGDAVFISETFHKTRLSGMDGT